MRLSIFHAGTKRLRKWLVALAVSVIATLSATSLLLSNEQNGFDESFYDLAYRLRRPVQMDVVIVTADQNSLDAMRAEKNHWGWPWPRQYWGMAIDYVQKCGGKAAVVDLFFSEPSVYNSELGDDAALGGILDELKMPVIFPVLLGPGAVKNFAPPVKRPPIIAAVNMVGGSTVRDYFGSYNGVSSVAVEAVQLTGTAVPSWAGQKFRLHYYGKHQFADGHTTFPYISASNVFAAALDPEHPQSHGIDPSIFAGKIVLFGTTAAGTFDVKASPLDSFYPGVEIHATAIANLLEGERVTILGGGTVTLITLLAATVSAIGAMMPRRTTVKLSISAAVVAVLFLAVAILFRRDHMIWLPPVSPLLGTVFAVVLALSWSYFAEDRQSRFFLKALGQYVSPHVAAELKADPTKLAISTEKRELTILFSDIAGFTDLTESLGEKIGPLLNYYLDEMSQPIWEADGTIDKYIGDAIMSFWNAPLLQSDHAVSACAAALAMNQRLKEIQPELAALEAPGLAARIGISTGLCTFGNMGSRSKFNYSVIGDDCNFASRLEGANKLYGTRILIGETTAKLVRDRYVIRKIDMLRVKGKQRPVAVYELIAAGLPDQSTAKLIFDYESALQKYSACQWDAAEATLLDILKYAPDDGPSHTLMSRIAAFREVPPPADWDGVFVAKEK